MEQASQIIRKLRLRRNLSMRQVASGIGVPLTTYREWEEHGRSIRSDNLLKLANYFGVSVETLIGGKKMEQMSIEDRINRIIMDLSILRAQIKEKKDLC